MQRDTNGKATVCFLQSGYKDGVDKGKEQTLQEGFDKGIGLS